MLWKYPGPLAALLYLQAIVLPMHPAVAAHAAAMSGAAESITAAAEAQAANAPTQPFVLLGAHEQGLRSRTGKEYRIFVSTPAAPAPPGGWPVVYVLDGNAWFPHAGQQTRLQGNARPDKTGVVPAVVVGVGYPGDAYINSARRTWDFTPDVVLREPNPERWVTTGGADEFMSFLEDELKPVIARQFKVDPDREILFGHSLGGLFALHAYFRHPGSFDAIVSASPSVWWNDRFMIDEATAFVGRHRQHLPDTRLLIAMGGEELPYMVADPKRLFETLAPLVGNGADIALDELADENHLSAAPVALNRLMQRFLAPTATDLAFYASLLPPGSPAPTDGLVETVRRHDSRITGRSYDVREFTPRTLPPATPLRAIYVLEDGPVLQAALAVAAASATPTRVVAIATAGEPALTVHELTPTPNTATPGGAEDLLRFLHHELVPMLDAGDAHGDSVVVGSGQAGLFALYALSNEPSTFGAVVAVDPAVEWRNRFLLSMNVIGRLEPKLETRRQSARVVLVTEGEATEPVRALHEKLDAANGVSVRLNSEGGDRVKAIAKAIEAGFALRDEAVPAQPRTFVEDTGFPVPSKDEYLALTPQERFEMRMRLRGIEPAPQAAWVKQFKYVLDEGLWYLDHRILHEEKERMDEINNYRPGNQ